ncbi:MAG: DegV family protein [Clostridia bacterium]|nr:DegV family protein [Clostridia bacterium]
MIKLVTDSTAYIPEDILKQYDIRVLSLSVSFGNEIYKETEITNNFFYEKLKLFNDFPKSSQPSLEESMSLYEEILSEGHDLVGVFISSEMSGTYQSACMLLSDLQEKYPNQKIQFIDSRSNCMQMGLAVIEGAKRVEEGFDAVVSRVFHVISNSRFVFIPDTLEYLKKGGRIGTAQALLGSLLQLKPILTVTDGKTHALDKVRTRKKAIQSMIHQFLEDTKDHSVVGVYVHHIDCEEDARNLSEMIGGTYDIAAIGPVIGTHVGPGAIGIAYCWE